MSDWFQGKRVQFLRIETNKFGTFKVYGVCDEFGEVISKVLCSDEEKEIVRKEIYEHEKAV